MYVGSVFNKCIDWVCCSNFCINVKKKNDSQKEEEKELFILRKTSELIVCTLRLCPRIWKMVVISLSLYKTKKSKPIKLHLIKLNVKETARTCWQIEIQCSSGKLMPFKPLALTALMYFSEFDMLK